MSRFVKLGFFFGLFFVVLALAGSSYAISDDDASENTSDVTISVSPEKKRENKEVMQLKKTEEVERKIKEKSMAKDAKISKAMERKANKLSEARLKICEGREEKIGNRFKSLIALGEKTHAGKEKIVERVDGFYTNVLVPAGHTLPNYETLKADIEVKETAVKAALEAAQVNGQEFSCDSDDPKAQADEFKENVQTLIAANKAYKQSVRTFVVSVRDLAKQARSTSSGSTTKADKLTPSPAVSSAEEGAAL